MPDPKVDLLLSILTSAVVGAFVLAWCWLASRLAEGKPVLPSEGPRLVPWGAATVGASILAFLAVPTAAQVVYVNAVLGISLKGASLSPAEIMALSAAANVALVAILALTLSLATRAWPAALGVARSDLGRQALRGLVAYPIVAPAVLGVMAGAIRVWKKDPHPLERAMAADKSAGMVLLLAFGGVVLAPLVEELIFRGIVLGWLDRLAIAAKPAGAAGPLDEPGLDLPSLSPLPGGEGGQISAQAAEIPQETDDRTEYPPGLATRLLLANVLVSLVFGALHATVWPTPIPLFVLSMALGFLYQRTGSVVGPVVLHMAFNGVSTLVSFATPAPPPPPKPAPAAPVVGRRDGPDSVPVAWRGFMGDRPWT